MERVRLALRISKNNDCKRIERVNASKFFKRFLCEAGLRGVGMNFRSFASKAVS